MAERLSFERNRMSVKRRQASSELVLYDFCHYADKQNFHVEGLTSAQKVSRGDNEISLSLVFSYTHLSCHFLFIQNHDFMHAEIYGCRTFLLRF